LADVMAEQAAGEKMLYRLSFSAVAIATANIPRPNR